MSKANDQAKIRDEAAEWIVHFSLDGLSEPERLQSLQRFQRWVRTDARHRHEYERAEQAWFDLAELKAHPEAGQLATSSSAAPMPNTAPTPASESAVTMPSTAPAPAPEAAVTMPNTAPAATTEPATTSAEPGSPNRNASWNRPTVWNKDRPTGFQRFLNWLTGPRLALSAAAVAAVVFAILTLPTLMPDPATQARYTTRLGEIKTFALADGSQVTLGARSVIQVRLDSTQRQVELLTGDAFFDVAKAPERPFTVTAGTTQVKVVGTRFDLQRGPREVSVAVVEGVVQVQLTPADTQAGAESTAAEPSNVTITAGQRVSTRDNRLTPVVAFDPAQTQDWQSGRFVYEDASLAEIIADANRYSQKPITLGDDTLADLTITTVYQVGQQEQMLRTFQLVLPIEVVETPVATILKPKR